MTKFDASFLVCFMVFLASVPVAVFQDVHTALFVLLEGIGGMIVVLFVSLRRDTQDN